MKKSPLNRSSPEDIRAWRREAARRYEERKRREGKKYISIGHNRERREKRFERQYESEERVRWIREQPSVVSGKRPCVNAHVKAGGMGMKADAKWIVPLTQEEHDELHRGQQTFEDKYDVDLLEEAKRIEEAWQARGETDG